MPENKENVMKEMVMPVVVLVAICLVCSALLAVLNSATAPIIEENTKKATLAAYLSVLPEGTDAAALTDLAVTTAGVEGAVQSPDGMTAVKASAAGYSGNAVIVYVSFDANGAIANMAVDASTQTTGIGSKVSEEKFYSGFLGWSDGAVSAGNPVDTIGGATYSSDAVFAAVNAAIDCYNNELKGVA